MGGNRALVVLGLLRQRNWFFMSFNALAALGITESHLASKLFNDAFSRHFQDLGLLLAPPMLFNWIDELLLLALFDIIAKC